MQLPAPRDYTIVDMAKAFAIAAHEAVQQKRKYTGDPYYRHPLEVFDILCQYYDPTPEQQCAALLHDVVEDTGVTLEVIRQVFGAEVARLVEGLTDVPPSAGTRKERNAMNKERLANAGFSVQIIKCSDTISNARSIVARDKDFAYAYVPEKLASLSAMKRKMAGEPIFIVAFEIALASVCELWGLWDDRWRIVTESGMFDGTTVTMDDFINLVNRDLEKWQSHM